MNKYEFNSKLFSNKEIRKITSAETIEAKDEYLVIKTTKNQEIQKNNPKLKDKTKIIPKYVATPFPPLNFNQTGKTCPMKQINADREVKSSK